MGWGKSLNTVVIEGESADQQDKLCQPANLTYTVLKETPASFEAAITVSGDGWLMLSDTWYPGWKATLDGKSVQILRGFSIFRVIHIPAGSHVYKMQYQSASFTAGAGLSSLGVLFLCILWGYERKAIKKSNHTKT